MIVEVLRGKDFRRLWVGSTVSVVGDGMTFVALSWLVLAQPHGVSRLGLLGVCYTAPVVVGGLAVGWLLDRFDKRTVLATDCVFRAVVVASVPVGAAIGGVPDWLPFVVAAVYGLLKMVPLAGFPAAIPALVGDAELDAANALESLSFSVASVVGPVAAGLLIGWLGAPAVLAVDSGTFLVFAGAAALVRQPLRPAARVATDRPSLTGLLTDRVIVSTTVAFMLFNVAEGMLLVTAPWLAKNELPGGAGTLGALLAATAAGELVGATVAGSRGPRVSPLRAIGVTQLVAACAYLMVLAGSPVAVGAGFFAVGLLSAPLTVWAQSLRMRLIPAELHGRAFALLRTLMQGTLPLGAALVAPLLAHGALGWAAMIMTLVAGVPGLVLVALGRLSAVPTLK